MNRVCATDNTPSGSERTHRRHCLLTLEDVRGDDPDLAAKLRVEERELEAGGVN